MAWYDRDYYRSEPYGGAGFARWSTLSVTIWLIIVNVAVFFADRLAAGPFGYPPLTAFGYFSADTAIYGLQLWRFVTFQFLHANLMHLLFNMLGLYFFGPIIESYLGRKRFLAFYLLCGVAGAATYLLLWAAQILISASWVPLVGASAGIFGILIATARIAPDVRVFLLFPPIPLRMRTLAWILLGLAAFTILTQGPNAGGQAAHLGGAALGFALIERPRLLNLFDRHLRTWRWGRPSTWRLHSNRW